MYKVYVNDDLITFSAGPLPADAGGGDDDAWEGLSPCTGALIRSVVPPASGDAGEFSITNLLQKVRFTKRLHVISPWADEIFALFRDSARVIEAAGGLVRNDAGDVLMIRRLGKWDLPKGKREEWETMAGCAVREVAEECGLEGMKSDGFLADTYHAYWIGAHPVLKRTSWFAMRYWGDREPVPQAEENIESAVWVKPAGIPEKLRDSYETVRDVFRAAGFSF